MTAAPRAFFSRPRPRLFGHRGAAGVCPENTLESFRRALADGAEYLEMDVHASLDGVIVVIHDPGVERTTDGAGAVNALLFEEIRKLDAGYRFEARGAFRFRDTGIRVPALAEVLGEFPGVPLNVEVKQVDPPIEPAVVALLGDAGALERVVLAAEDDAIMQRLRALAPENAASFSALEAAEFFRRCFEERLDGYSPPGRALQIPPRFGAIDLVTPQTVRAAHELGVEMHVWTINDAREMERLLALGVDGLMSDFPALLRDTVKRRVSSA